MLIYRDVEGGKPGQEPHRVDFAEGRHVVVAQGEAREGRDRRNRHERRGHARKRHELHVQGDDAIGHGDDAVETVRGAPEDVKVHDI
jgi:hypothetical protein